MFSPGMQKPICGGVFDSGSFGSGSVKHPSGYCACIGLSASLPQPSVVLFGVLESRLLGLVPWFGLERRSARSVFFSKRDSFSGPVGLHWAVGFFAAAFSGAVRSA